MESRTFAPLTAAEKEKIHALLQNVPAEDLPHESTQASDWNPHKKAAFDGTADPFRFLPNLKVLGNLPTIPSGRIGHSALGIGLETLDRDTFNPDVVIPLLGKAGVKYARCQTGWIKCEKEKGVYDFGWLDHIADLLLEGGVEPWFSLSFGNPLYTPNEAFAEQWRIHENKADIPGWARGYVGEVPLYHGEEATQAFLAYVRALVRHFLGRVRIFEVWNEPEGFWRKNGEKMVEALGAEQAARDYVELVRLTAQVIREECPEAKVVSVTATAGTSYIRALGRAGLGRYIDAHSFHSYTPYAQGPEWYLEQRTAHLRRCLTIDGRTPDLIQGESGRASGLSMIRSVRPSEYGQAKYIARRYFGDLSTGVKITSLFTASDFVKYYADGSDQFYGVIGGKGERKLGYYTVAACAALFDGLEPDDGLIALCFPENDTFSETMEYYAKTAAFRRKGVPMFAVWNPSAVDLNHETRMTQLRLVLDDPNEMPDPVIIDPIRRTVCAIDAKFYPQSSRYHLFISPFPLTDYPLIVTDLRIFRDF